MQQNNGNESFMNLNPVKRKKRGFSIPQIPPVVGMPLGKSSQTEEKSSDHKKTKKDSKKEK